MNNSIKILCCLLLIAAGSFSYGQMAEYNYKREINAVTEQWHKIIMPNEIFGKTSQDLSGIRILGLTEGNDTIEVPYFLQLTTEKIYSKEVAFKTINPSHNYNGYYFTFEIPTKEPINQINLDFTRENFDWSITLEGSQDQNEWFKVVEDYRILSVNNNNIDFKITKLTFPSSKYRFFRVLIDSKEKPGLTATSITQHEIIEGTFRKYNVQKINVKKNMLTKQTEIDVDLELPVRVSKINIVASDTFDYYRPVTIKYLADSFKTEQGWKYNYKILTIGILNSIEKNDFQFSSTTVQKLKIFITNHDNQSLTIETIEVKGYIHELIAHFTSQATYYLMYGNNNPTRPHYDIERFTDRIPKNLKTLELGDELTIEKEEVPVTDPLFVNKIWLWIIMTVIILLLGGFSVKMIKTKEYV